MQALFVKIKEFMDKFDEIRNLVREIRDLLRDALRKRPGPVSGPEEIPADRDALLNEKQVAKELGVSPGTLKNWRSEKKGPEWVKIERSVRYRRSAVDKFKKR
jgi:predicted DNA-binding transcriptional regulator AlpA